MDTELEIRQKKNNGILTLDNKQEDPEF